MSPEDFSAVLSEIDHQHNNDLQLVVGLLAFQVRNARSFDARETLKDVMQRVMALAHARAAQIRGQHPDLTGALQGVSEALQSLAAPRAIGFELDLRADIPTLRTDQVTVLALIVNDLANNAIQHAFTERQSGLITIATRIEEGALAVTVDDDGLPFDADKGTGGGLTLIDRLAESIGASIARPDRSSKLFEIRCPLAPS